MMKQNGHLTIKQIYQVEIAIFMYKTVKKSILVALQNLFESKSSRMFTRSNSVYISPAYRLTSCQQSIKFCGPKIWSKLSNAIKERKSLKSFSDKFKTHFLNIVSQSRCKLDRLTSQLFDYSISYELICCGAAVHFCCTCPLRRVYTLVKLRAGFCLFLCAGFSDSQEFQ